MALLQDKGDFELATLPALVPVFTSASGETLLLLVKHADLIINKVIRVTCEISIDYIIPLCYLWGRLGELQLQLLRRESLPTSQTLKMPTDSSGHQQIITSPFTLRARS